MFLKGCKHVGADSLDSWRKAVPGMQKEFASKPDVFEEVYEFTFSFYQEPGFKNIEKETACALWEILLSNRCKFMKEWLKFIETKYENNVVKKDQWTMFLQLVDQTGGDIKKFEDDGCWPSIIDDFMEFLG
mmetsp:Transcript_13626/g.21327  ORF Transcript_13626/g.21327 Transcript_13626/m.21327 type:complete len:131 (+) Transcript_13626:384-776(+)